MATTAELIKGLVENRNILQAQVDALNAAIQALGGAVAAPAAAAKPAVKAAPAVAEAPATEAPRRGRKPGSKNSVVAKPAKTGRGGGRKPADINYVENFEDATSWNEKVIWALSKQSKMTADEIATAIATFEPGSDLGKLKTMVSSYASTLTKRGLVTAKREGRGYIYSLTSEK